jgi:hypothetical protein
MAFDHNRPMRFTVIAAMSAAMLAGGCGACNSTPKRSSLDAAARSYVRLVLALGERDSDSLDSYHGPPTWETEARHEHATLGEIRAGAMTLADSLRADRAAAEGDEQRRGFLIRQLDAIATRVDVLQGTRPAFDDEARRLFAVDWPDQTRSDDERVRAELDRLLPGRGDLAERYAAFDRQFLIPSDRLAAVLSRAIEGCRAATRQHVALPTQERVRVDYVRDSSWSAFTRYEGRFVSRILVNAALPVTVDRALDLACHEAYPGHHTISVLLDARFGERRPELLVQPLFSPQSSLHEAAASLAPALAFSEAARIAFERDELFPLAGLDAADAARHATVGRLVDRLHPVVADVARQYLDGVLDFPRAAAALQRDALMPNADATLKFVNQFRSYAATYTVGRDRLSRVVAGNWASYLRAVTDPAQTLPRP